MANRTLDVAAFSPKVTGGLLYAPLGTALPTDETTALNVAFKALGYVSEDGISPSGDATSLTDVPAWGGSTVATLVDSLAVERYQFTLLGYYDADVNQFIWGTSNVVVTAATSSVGSKMAIKTTAYTPPLSSFCFEMNYNGKLERRIAPNAQFIVTNEQPLVHNELAGYECELTCLPDSSGVKTYRYLANTDKTG